MRPAQTHAGGGMLDNLTVIDIGTMVAAPVAGTLMADFGASVIKVEQPGSGDTLRGVGPLLEGESLWWHVDGRNKKSISLNLRTAKGQAVLKRLAAKADALVENFRPGTLAKWGLDYESLAAVNPRLVMLSVSGFGQTGPLAQRAGYDRIGLAFSGLMALTGYPDRPPVRIGTSMADYTTAVLGAFALMTALYSRDANGGRGQQIDLALYEAIFRFSESMTAAYDRLGFVRQRTGNVHYAAAPGNNFETSDGRYMTLTCSGDVIFRRLCEAMERPDLLDDPALATHEGRWEHIHELNDQVGAWIKRTPVDELTEKLDRYGVAYSIALTIPDIVEHPHYVARENIVTVDHPTLGPIKMQGVVPKFSHSPARPIEPAPSVGQHNEEIYLGLLGMERGEYDGLRAEGVI
ncbi:formyl-CoA transferase [Bordetella bronchiseptica]|nr:formyl-CoA transferase [Bordetella bronchiseptica]